VRVIAGSVCVRARDYPLDIAVPLPAIGDRCSVLPILGFWDTCR